MRQKIISDDELFHRIEIGKKFLYDNNESGRFDTFISPNRDFTQRLESPRDIATSSLILSAAFEEKNELSDIIARYLIEQANDDFTYCFFEDGNFPSDVDTTSFTLFELIRLGYVSLEDTKPALEKIVNNNSSNGFEIYFKPEKYGKKNRFDLVASCNVGRFLGIHNEKEEFKEELKKVIRYFETDSYLQGERYWFSPDSSIYFATKLNEIYKSSELNSQLVRAIHKRNNTTQNTLDLAMRSKAAQCLETKINENYTTRLLELQNKNGSFLIDAIYKRGSREEYFGSETLTTAFAIEALRNN